MNPVDRLGYGLPDTPTSMKALTEHPFFASIKPGDRPIPAEIREFYEEPAPEETKT